MSYVAEGFERFYVREKLQFFKVARGSSAQVRFFLYVVEDNYPVLSADAIRLREKSVQAGKLVTELIRSLESQKSKIAGLLSSISHLLSPV